MRGKRTRTILAFRACRSATQSNWSESIPWAPFGDSLSKDSIGDGEVFATRFPWEVDGEPTKLKMKSKNKHLNMPTSSRRIWYSIIDVIILVVIAILILSSSCVFITRISFTIRVSYRYLVFIRVMFRFAHWGGNTNQLRFCNAWCPTISEYWLIWTCQTKML